MEESSRRVTLAARPVGVPQESDFALDEVELAAPGAAEVLVRVLWVSLDPYQRGRMNDARSYAAPLELGEVITALGVGEVVESGDARYSPGELVVGPLGWQEHAVVPARTLRRDPARLEPPSLALHAVGMTGFTAYFGLFDVGRPRPGDLVVVSGAAGAVGQIVGQLAKLAGCTVVGIAGGAEKTRDLLDLYGYDHAVDYKADDFRSRLRDACADGADLYFDNVGGDVSAAVHARLNVGARIVICGQISQYNLERPVPTFNPGLLIVHRARMEGFLVSDFAHRFDDAAERLSGWVGDGTIRWREDVTDGLENAPRAFIGMLGGTNRGKALVRVSAR